MPTVVRASEALLASERGARTLPQEPSALLASERASRTVPQAGERTEPDFDAEIGRKTDPDEPELATAGAPRSVAASREEPEDGGEPRPSGVPSYIGMLIDDRYLIEALIAKGGMGVVYRCRHKVIGKRFAVKIIRPDIARSADAPQRLLIEAKAASAAGNSHIIDISDFGQLPDGSSYLVMELLDGVPLSTLIGNHEILPLPRILSLGLQIAEGLMAAHDAGIVHRDLKPENVFVLQRNGEDFVKILDFGIAKMACPDDVRLTRAGMIVGTPHYMSPEQAAGSTVDHRVDVYSLGILLYELTTGRVPFYGANYMSVLTRLLTEPPAPFRALIPPPDVPPEFEGVVLKCLAKRPGDRFQSMQELFDALVRVEGMLTPAPRLTPNALCAPSELPVDSAASAVVSVRAEAPRHSGGPLPLRRARHVVAASLLLLGAWLWPRQGAWQPSIETRVLGRAGPAAAPTRAVEIAPTPRSVPDAPSPDDVAAPAPAPSIPLVPAEVASAASPEPPVARQKRPGTAQARSGTARQTRASVRPVAVNPAAPPDTAPELAPPAARPEVEPPAVQAELEPPAARPELAPPAARPEGELMNPWPSRR